LYVGGTRRQRLAYRVTAIRLKDYDVMGRM
jgi:hypothetical protein